MRQQKNARLWRPLVSMQLPTITPVQLDSDGRKHGLGRVRVVLARAARRVGR